MADNEILEKLNGYFQTSLDHPTTLDWLTNAQKDFEFREGKQWSSEEKTQLSSRGQPDIIENQILPRINRLIGQYKQMKTRLVFKGRNLPNDEPVAQLLSDLMLYIQQNCSYEHEEEAMFDDGVVSGLGILEIFVEFDDMYRPSIIIKHEDSLNFLTDPYSRRYDWDDANWVIRWKWVTPGDADSIYPGKGLKDLFTTVGAGGKLSGIENLKHENYVDSTNNRLRLVEVWYKEKEKQTVALGEQVIDVTKETKKKIGELKRAGYEIIERLVPKIKMGVFCADVLCEHKDSPYHHNDFPFVPYYVYRKKSGEPYSIVRSLIDPQTEVNKRRSKALHFLNTNQLVMEEGAVRDEDEAKVEAAKPDGLLKIRPGYYEKFSLNQNIELAASQMNMLAESSAAISKISGMPDQPDSTGQLRSGVAVARKQMGADLVITPIFDNLRRTRLLIGKRVLELIKQYFKNEDIFYITDDMNKVKEVPLKKEHIDAVKSGSYDVVVEDAPAVATIQQEEFNAMSELVKSFNLPPNLSMAIFPLMIEMSELKNKDKILQKFQEISQPSPLQPKMSLNLTWDNLDSMERSAFSEMMGLPQLAQYEKQAQKPASYEVKAQTDMGKEKIKAQAGMMNSAQDPMMKKEELNQKREEMGMKREEHQMDMQHEHEKHVVKMKEGRDKHVMNLVQAKQKGDMAREQNEQRNNPES